jgi:UDP-N-acetylmuramoylalanine--D-glutamate ligase
MQPLFFRNPGLRFWFQGRRICVVGLGKSGIAAARLLVRCGARVSMTDKRSRRELRAWLRQLPSGVPCETGGHAWLARPWDLVVVSPGVPESIWSPLTRRGVPVWGELELAVRILELTGRWPRRAAAVTGTNGKTTTTAFLGTIFRAAGWRTVVAGNIGTPLSAVVESVNRDTALVLEVSSYQLETSFAFRPAAGAVLNITPDHLGRHQTMARYAATKFRLFANQSSRDGAVLNRRDAWCRRLVGHVPGTVAWFGPGAALDAVRNRLVCRLPGRQGAWPPPRRLSGRHNLENALAAIGCARFLGAPAAAVDQALRTFPGVEHRLEEVRRWRGIRFINDSKATNVDSTAVALDALPGPLHVILGGEHKGAPYTPLRRRLVAKAKEVLLIGEAAPVIERDLKGSAPLVRCGDLKTAVAAAVRNAKPGETVLLSPACASFDQFDNFEQRGRVFKEAVAAL